MDILAAIDAFFKTTKYLSKTSGILAVPEDLLEPMQRWARSVWSYHQLKAIQEIKNKFNFGTLFLQDVKEEAQDLRPIFNDFTAEKLFNAALDNQINIGNVKYTADTTGRRFNYEVDEFPACKISIKSVDDLYHLYIWFEDPEYGKTVAAKNITKQKVLDIIQDYQDSILTVAYNFIQGAESLEQHPLNEKTLKSCIAELSRYIDPEYRQTKLEMKIPGEGWTQFPTVEMNFVFEKDVRDNIYSKEEWLGLYFNYKIYIYAEIFKTPDILSVELIQKVLSNITRVVRHEAQHLVQIVIKDVARLHEPGGLPPQKVRNAPKDEVKKEKSVSNIYNQSIEHQFRDIEFHTRIADSVDQFKDSIQLIPINLRREFFNTWVANGLPVYYFSTKFKVQLRKSIDPESREYLETLDNYYDVEKKLEYNNNLFSQWKTQDQLRWMEATKQLYKAVSSYFA